MQTELSGRSASADLVDCADPLHHRAKNTRANALPVKNTAPKARPSKPCKAYLSPLVASARASSIAVAAERTGSRVALAAACKRR